MEDAEYKRHKAIRDQYDRMAWMVTSIPGLTPADYWGLSRTEVDALSRALANRSKG